jgi:hypothetical protein
VSAKGQKLPILIESVLTLCPLAVLLMALAVALISFMSGCDLVTIIVRAGATILVLGFMFFYFAWTVARGTIRAFCRPVRQTASPDDVASSRDFKA